jgi:hypothetical protein
VPARHSPIQAAEKNGLSHSAAEAAYQLVLFQIVPGALFIDVLMGSELCGDLILRRGTGFDVFAKP